MALKFFNIKTKEVLTAETEPHIAALYNSSDKGPNVSQGQDFGWRLAPAVVVRMREIKEDFDMMLRIAKIYNHNVDELSDWDILNYISTYETPNADDATVASDSDYTDEYSEEIRKLEKRRQAAKDKAAKTDGK